MDFTGTFKVKPDGGQVDALSGATVTSRGVSAALTQAVQIYDRLKPEVKEKLSGFAK
jgi:electron transport complex protein RnfG